MKDYYNSIDEIRDFLSLDLIGPIYDDEVLVDDEPLKSYAIGILWPQRQLENVKTLYKQTVPSSLDDDENLEDSNESVDDTVGNSASSSNLNGYRPSVMGLSFTLPKESDSIKITFSYAKYSHDIIEQGKYSIDRFTREPNSIELDVPIPDKFTDIVCLDDEELKIRITLHSGQDRCINKTNSTGEKLITISVTNTAYSGSMKILQNKNALFQSELKIHSDCGFLPVYMSNHSAHASDDLVNDMLYKDVHNYAYGHGCATHYNGENNTISSDFLPCEKVYRMTPNTIKNNEILKLDYWNRTVDKATSLRELSAFVTEYQDWLELQMSLTKDYQDFDSIVELTFDNIKTCIKRLNNAIEVMSQNKFAYNSFLLMNEAMLIQRVKTKQTDIDSIMWYPFQLAYILQIIPDIVDSNSEYKNVVDLLWFPTGGGKTEAYLGVAGFTIFYERITNQSSDNHGVTVFMRYTLRLLTIQQFERAAALICSCDFLRMKYKISSVPISIGLYIGKSMTPNRLSEASSTLDSIRKDSKFKISESNPLQIEKCPWCGVLIDISCYDIGDNMTISCANNSNCEFHTGLPIYLIDDDIYSMRPTLVLSTIDKFARITWEEKVKNIFDNPLKLVIQDELHLISGPLGSLSGIYEIAVDALSENGYHSNTTNNSPKIIASTATVKNAKKQIKNLYNRDMLQFPPNGLSAEDSFFAIRSDLVASESNPAVARTYVGLCSMGGSITDLMIRIYSTLLFMKALFIKQGKPTNIIDHFYTTVGYFNSIKDLGASSSVISDRISSNVESLISHKFKEVAEKYELTSYDIPRRINNDELTSRKSSKEIKDTLSILEKPYTETGAYSYILASNMLSVGIDINRLGVMTVYNQPKSNSEYIQATSRVGRTNPGLVLTMYNSNRSRDKSHYEQFSFYHKTFYRYVEATSVTPFSSRAIEKALHCIFIALVRHRVEGMGGNNSARKFRANLNGIDQIKDFIIARVKDIYPDSQVTAKDWLDNIINSWEKLAISHPETLVYTSYNNDGVSLLISDSSDKEIDFPTTLNSLRNVEQSANVYIKRRKSN